MQTRFTYEAELEKDELGGYYASFPEIEGAFTDGDNLEHTVEMAAEVLELVLGGMIDEGKALPKAVFRGSSGDIIRIAISVEITPEDIERMKCLTVTEAAEYLAVSKGRISQMLDAGILETVSFGNDRLVTIASINERKRNPKRAGRPRKSEQTTKASNIHSETAVRTRALTVQGK